MIIYAPRGCEHGKDRSLWSFDRRDSDDRSGNPKGCGFAGGGILDHQCPDMARIFYPFVPLFFLSLKFNSIDKVRRLSVPKLFIHSPDDEVVPYWVGQKLYEAALPPKEFLKIHGGHNDGSITVDPTASGEFMRILKSKDLI